MLTVESKRKEYKIWGTLIAFLIVVFFLGWLLLEIYFQRELDQASEISKNNLNFISIIIQERLQKKNYRGARNFITNWGEKTPEIVQIILSTRNAYHLADYQRKLLVSHTITKSIDIHYSYTGLAHLEIIISLDEIYHDYYTLIIQSFIGYLLIAMIMFLLIFINLRTHKQKQQLLKEIKQRKEAFRVLNETELRLSHLVENVKKHYFFYTHDTNGVFTYLSQSITEILGYTQDEFLKHFDTYLTNDPINEHVALNTIKSLRGELQVPYSLSIYHKDGSIRYIEVTESPIFDNNNHVVGVEGIARDITEAHQSHQEKLESQKFLQSIIDGISDTVMVINKDYSLAMMNLATKNVINEKYIKDINQPKCYEILHHHKEPCSGKEHSCPLTQVLKTEQVVSVIHQDAGINGRGLKVQLTATPLKDKDNNIYAIIESAHNITDLLNTQDELRKRSDELTHLAHHDSLTELPNRLLLSDRLEQSIKLAQRHKEKIALLFIDLDNFKKVNDSLGHSVGDIILKEAANRLRNCVRDTDTVARLGGDEFTIIINEIENSDLISEITTKIIKKLQNKFQAQGHNLYVTTSIGISIYPDDADSSEELLRNADAAMYKAKEGGRNTYRYYTEDMTQKAFEHILMESNLRNALDHNELKVHYQPQVNAKTNQIIGMEALVRWQHPDLGIVSPDQFIPLAEKTGLIISLGEQVFDIASKQMASWMKDFQLTGRMAINLSAKQFQQDTLVESLSKLLHKNECQPEWIELEITENYIMEDPEQAIVTLQKFQDMGIKIAVDDFGTGYSSLAYLKRLPIDKLKIDQTFVQDIITNEDDRVIITSTTFLAKNMNLNVIAEGVETKEQKEFLLKEGCELIQGYYYSKPVSNIEMTQLLTFSDWSDL